MTYVYVVTRYGGLKHVAEIGSSNERHHTLCRGTSAWTLASWDRVQDHPVLTMEEIINLPDCPHCRRLTGLARPIPKPEPDWSWPGLGFLLDRICVSITCVTGISLIFTGLWFIGVALIIIAVASVVVSIHDDAGLR